MKQFYFRLFLPFVVLISILLITACSKKWEEHYDEESFILPEKTLNEYIRDYPELSIFYGMLKKTGYDKVLDASQSYTIWSPANDALMGIDTTDMELVLEIIKNHIAQSRFTTSNIDNKPIYMLNGKYINFTREASGFSFGDNSVINPDLPAINGLVHVIDGYVPYINNIWEYIGRTEGLDSLRSYLYSQSKWEFDFNNSVEIGYDSTGAAIYDTQLVFSNAILEKIGAINTEDHIYTGILPNNTAWNEAYGRIESYLNFPDNAGGAQRQREMTLYTLVKDMFFRGRVAQPEVPGSMVSTTGSVFYNLGNVFNIQPVTLSNGLAYVTGKMPYADTSSWFKEIRVEAEESENRVVLGCNVFLRTSYGSGMDVSESKYILVDPTSSSSTLRYSIPNTFSAKYNVYCVFVPASIVDHLNTIPTKVKFKFTYISKSTGSTSSTNITPENNVVSAIGMTKMFVGQFDLEYANIVDEEYSDVKVRLDVMNDVTTTEEQAGEYSRTMRIDCIILEPVSE